MFGTSSIRLRQGAEVSCQGTISIGPEVIFGGKCFLKGPLELDAGSILSNVRLGSGTVVRPYSIVSDSDAGMRNILGPFCFIRDRCIVEDDCVLGAHVETARSTFASGVKISHRAFVGDAVIGERTIIGAGVVFCNFDGLRRQVSRVGSDVTLGSGTLVVSPSRIGDRAVVGAGSVITEDVSEGTKIIQFRSMRS